MRIFEFYLPSVVLAIALVTLVTICEGKELKKKASKLRNDLNSTDIDANSTVANRTGDSSPIDPDADDIVAADVEKDEDADTEVSKPQKPTYMSKVKVIIKRVMEALGLRNKEKRKNRMMNIEENTVQPKYHEEVRATVGALLGQHDCLKKAACGAGNYLRSFKSKDIILVLLEKVAPPNWDEAITLVKEGTVDDNDCNYKCLDD